MASKAINLSDVIRLMHKRAVQTKWMKAISEAAEIKIVECVEFTPMITLAGIEIKQQEFDFNSYIDEKTLKVNLSFSEEKGDILLEVRIKISRNLSGVNCVDYKRFTITLNELKNPAIIFSQCTEGFDRARQCINDELGYIKGAIIKHAFSFREDMKVWLDKLTLLMVENDVTPKEEEILDHMLWSPSNSDLGFGESEQLKSKLYHYYANKKRIEEAKVACLDKQEGNHDRR